MKTLVILLITISCLGLAFGELYSGLQNKKVERTIDLTSQFARHSLQIEIENTGKTSASEYFVAIQEQNLAYLDAKDQAGVSLKVTKGATESSGKQSYTLYSVELSSALAAGATAKITVNAVYTHVQTPFPASVGQDEKQLVVYHGNHFFFTPYKTQSQTTTVKLSSSTLESYTKESPSSVSGNTITYGPYSDKAALSVSEMKLHYENNKPFLTATSATKEVEVSQWGNVAVEESYELVHAGAKLKGQFSRFAYQRSYRLNSNVVASLRQTLPQGAADVYYRDEIGNISTSNVNYHADEGVVFDLVPRFPLFGGWSIGFLYGYNLPTETYLHTSYQAGVYALNVSFAGTLSDVVADDYTLRVILPEGATDIEFLANFPVDSHSFATHYTYLDTSGRPVLIIKKSNVVPEHNQQFYVFYRFSQTSLLREPILLIGAYFALFAFILLWGRLPLSVGESKATYGPNADRVLNALARFKEISEQRNELHEALTEAVSDFVKTKNDKTWATAKKINETTIGNLTKDVTGVLAELDDVASDFGRRAREIQKKEEKKAQLGAALIDLELNYKVHKKIEKSSYEAQRGDLDKQFKTLEEEIENAVYDLTENL